MKKEYDNNPETNNSHVEHAVKLINKVINDYENGTLNKDTIWELGNHTWYHFMLNRIPRRDIDIFCEKFEGEVFFVQTSFYQKSENFLINAKIYKRLCDTVNNLYQNVYIKGRTQDISILYDFMSTELQNLVQDEPSEDYACPLVFGYVEDIIKIVKQIAETLPKNKLSDKLIEKSSILLNDFNNLFITDESTSRAIYYDYSIVFDDNKCLLKTDTVTTLRKKIKELSNYILLYCIELY